MGREWKHSAKKHEFWSLPRISNSGMPLPQPWSLAVSKREEQNGLSKWLRKRTNTKKQCGFPGTFNGAQGFLKGGSLSWTLHLAGFRIIHHRPCSAKESDSLSIHYRVIVVFCCFVLKVLFVHVCIVCCSFMAHCVFCHHVWTLLAFVWV